MEIDGKTGLIGLIGNPVEHTLSPVIHNGISERMGINSVYVPFKVEKEGLEDAVKGAYALNILGMNVTVPHKNQVMEYLEDIDEAAGHIGAVNTLVRMKSPDGKDATKAGYKGYNTDMLGLRRQIREDGISLKGKNTAILGAGGAAKAVVYMCLSEGAKTVYLLNRTVEKAEAVAKAMNAFYAKEAVIPMALQDYGKIDEKDLIVFQATSIGLAPDIDSAVLEAPAFYEKVSVGVDLIYNPADTKFMRLVTEHGGKAYNALKMLLYQGVIAYELWHDVKVPRDIVEDVYTDLKRKMYQKDNIVFIGFMGSGKTTVGKELAKRLKMNFLDTDSYIENRTGKSIPEIFAKEGEEAFRRLETEALQHLRDTVKNTVISTGGGMPLKRENAGLLKEIGRVYYLTAADSIIYERVKGDSDRPLLRGSNPYERIHELMKNRAPLYERAADIWVDTNCNDLEEVIARVKEDWAQFGNRTNEQL